MKFLILIPLLGLLASSCRTTTPIDPMTMRPSTQCLPENYQGRIVVDATK